MTAKGTVTIQGAATEFDGGGPRRTETEDKDMSETHALEWKQRFIEQLIPRLAGDGADKEQALELVLSAMETRYIEGIKDAALTARSIAERSDKARQIGTVIANALDSLARLNVDPDEGKRLG